MPLFHLPRELVTDPKHVDDASLKHVREQLVIADMFHKQDHDRLLTEHAVCLAADSVGVLAQ